MDERGGTPARRYVRYAEGAYLHAEQYAKGADTKDITEFVGIDVLPETIAVGVADQQSGLKPVRSFG